MTHLPLTKLPLMVFALSAFAAQAACAEPESKPESAVASTAPSPSKLAAGDKAPDFTATGDDGKEYSLSKLAGKYVILYFYPKDDTPGCTVEAQGFRDDEEAYEAKGAVVIGVSMDSQESHQAFRSAHDLNFPLLTNARKVADDYGVPVRFGYASRQTFVIGKDGVLLKVFRSVKPAEHSKEILSLLK